MSGDFAPPADLATWLGGLVLTAAVGALVGRVFRREEKTDQAEANWRAEVRADLKSLVEGQAEFRKSQAVQDEKLHTLDGRLGALEERQNKQAEAHIKAVEALRTEFGSRRKAGRE